MVHVVGDTIEIATSVVVAGSSARHVGDSISIAESASVSVGGARQASDFIEVDDAAAVLLSAGPVTARRAEATAVSVKPNERRIVPDVRADLDKNAWDLATIGTGVGVGVAVGRLPGAIIGGVVLYAWGQWRWRTSR